MTGLLMWLMWLKLQYFSWSTTKMHETASHTLLLWNIQSLPSGFFKRFEPLLLPNHVCTQLQLIIKPFVSWMRKIESFQKIYNQLRLWIHIPSEVKQIQAKLMNSYGMYCEGNVGGHYLFAGIFTQGTSVSCWTSWPAIRHLSQRSEVRQS